MTDNNAADRRGYPMDVQTVDIEVMKSELQALRSDVHGIDTKMDVIIQMQVSITQIQERQESQRIAIDRAFTAIKETREIAHTAKAEIARLVSFAKGGVAIGVLLMGFTNWYLLGQVEKIDRIDKVSKSAYFALERRLIFMENKLWPDMRPGEKPSD